MQCGNNVKQLCLGLQNYHDTFLYLPYGARVRTPANATNASWGTSWLTATLPFCEQRPLFDKMVAGETAGDYVSATANAPRSQAHNAKIKYMLCPSSPLPETQVLGSFTLIIPSYVGIMGGCAETNANLAINVSRDQGREATGPYSSTPGNAGLGALGNGMLPFNDSLTFAACTDGTANCMIVGEVSDWYYNNSAQRQNPAMSMGIGWIAGTNQGGPTVANGPPRPLGPAPNLASVSANTVMNIVTVNHSVGINNRQGANDPAPDWSQQGIGQNGLNNPLLSGHPAGAMIGYLDGHVQLLTKQTATYVLKRLAIRDDGGVIPDF
jgi:prepilin-type processing-associated H-X9-DG protein